MNESTDRGPIAQLLNTQSLREFFSFGPEQAVQTQLVLIGKRLCLAMEMHCWYCKENTERRKNIHIIFVVTGAMLDARASTYLSVLPIFLVSLSIHEYAHAWVAYRYGDDTAKRMGRLTLNPLAHISLLGTIILPLVVHFGWAKPVPVNFSILTKSQIFKVAAAGPTANILLTLILTGAFHLLGLRTIPLLGNFVLLAILFNIILAVFNLIPIPPLDGSKMVYAKLKSPQAINTYNKLAPFGMLVVVGFLLLGGFEIVILPLAALFYTLLGLPSPALIIGQKQKSEVR